MIEITVSDEKNSKGFKIDNIDFEELFYKILFYTKQLQKYKSVKLICYERGKNDNKTIN